jgi:chromosome partitioning protein
MGDIIAGSEDLFQADTVVVGSRKEYRLKEMIDGIKEVYDYIIIDTPSVLGILTVNAMVASNSVVIASQAESYNLTGIDRISRVIRSIRECRNNNLLIKGILLKRFKERTVLNRDFAELISKFAKELDTKVYKATIRDSIVISESQARRMSIYDYDVNSKVAKD